MTTLDLQDSLPNKDMNVTAVDEKGNQYEVQEAEVVKQDGKKKFVLTIKKQ